MSLESLFSRYGSPVDECSQTIHCYLRRTDRLRTAEEVQSADQSAARYLQEFEALAQDMREYRKALAARYAELDTMPYRLRLELERCPEGYRKTRIWYYVRIRRIYEDGTEVKELEERYPGPERNKAFSRYAALQKERPGIALCQDTEKRSWER